MSRLPWARKCSARCSDGSPCGAWAIRGGTVCKVHGGSAPQVRAAAARRLFELRMARHAEHWEAMSEHRRNEITSTLLGLDR